MKPERTVPTHRDQGTVLPIVLVLSVVLALVVVALADYTTSTLRLGQVTEDAATRLATANGAMDNALEDIQRNASRCLLFGEDYAISDTINDITAEISCHWTSGEPNLVDQFAVIITGDGAGRTDALLTITNGGNSAQAEKIFEGPVYLAKPPTHLGADPTLDFNATLTIKNGDLWYSHGTCPAPGVAKPNELTISPAGYGIKCIESDWTTLFASRRPPEPAVTNPAAFPLRSNSPPTPVDGCSVWEPGRYTGSGPNLANNSYNYFRSGDYYFDNVGEWSVSNAFVLFGWPGATGPSIDGPNPQDTFANNPCRDQWTEVDQSGAAIYLGGNSTITVRQGSTVEISGRDHGGYNVGIQALEGTGASTIRGNNTIVSTGPGSNKQLSVQGLVWAPYASFAFDLISNDAVAALTSGAVVGELHAGASANANNFVIRVDTQPTVSTLRLTSTAELEGATTAVRVTASVRSTGRVTEYALHSRRVLNLTPE